MKILDAVNWDTARRQAEIICDFCGKRAVYGFYDTGFVIYDLERAGWTVYKDLPCCAECAKLKTKKARGYFAPEKRQKSGKTKK